MANINSALNRGANLLRQDVLSSLYGSVTKPDDLWMPYEFTSPKEEVLAAYETAWIGTYLQTGDGIGGHFLLTGPDAVKFMNKYTANRDFALLKAGGSRNVMVCDDDGYIRGFGLFSKVDEDTYRASCSLFLAPLAAQSGMDVTVVPLAEYWIQIDGRKSLEILEDATKTDLHDLRFGQHKTVKCAGSDMLVHRLGISGNLAYEVHGPIDCFEEVYSAIVASGEKFCAKRQGVRNYCGVNHTPAGYHNSLIHWLLSDGNGGVGVPVRLTGTAAGDAKNYLVTPFECGWGWLVNFDHDFIGKEALLRQKETGDYRRPVTLEWNLDDLGALIAAEIAGTVEEDEEVMAYNASNPEYYRGHADLVKDGDRVVGFTAGRAQYWYRHTFISIGYVSADAAVDGKELTVMWGKADGKQTPIRAKVVTGMYYQDEWRNETCDVMKMVPERPYL